MFNKKIKVTFYMKSGNIFTLKFKEFEISKLSGTKGSRSMTYTEPNKTFTIDIEEIEACIIN